METDFVDFSNYELIIMAVAGLLVMFAGYRIKKIAFFIVWFLLGMSITSNLMPSLTGLVPEIAENPLWQNLLPLAGGLLLALLGFTIEKLCVGGICFVLVMAITVQYFGTEVPTLLIGAVVGVIAAALAVRLMKPAIIIATALAGAYVLTIGILTWIPGISREIFYFPLLVGLAAIGAVAQFATTKHIE